MSQKRRFWPEGPLVDGGTPITYPGAGTSFMLPLRPPYTTATVVMCGGSWGQFNYNEQTVAVINPGFSTHSLQMSQRYVQLDCSCTAPVARADGCDASYIATVSCVCTIPVSANVTPPGDYMLTLLDGKVPSQARWISIG
ncbi:hypothetical protein WJX81_006088 [Elliptochloris bilobata]|uniref:Galactose oxidase-like Early set domain-containing protein n=1 Tax=Elliptochloris bilobata TaxID=381761 RepID=A0AAW1RMW2_9CHLO